MIVSPAVATIIEEETDNLMGSLSGDPTAWRRAIVASRIKLAVKRALLAAKAQDAAA